MSTAAKCVKTVTQKQTLLGCAYFYHCLRELLWLKTQISLSLIFALQVILIAQIRDI